MNDIDLTSAILDKITTMKDGSLKITVVTQELPPQEMAKLFMSVNQEITNVKLPKDSSQPKSKSERLRNVIYRLWEQEYTGKYPDHNLFYESYMDQTINKIKDKLN